MKSSYYNHINTNWRVRCDVWCIPSFYQDPSIFINVQLLQQIYKEQVWKNIRLN